MIQPEHNTTAQDADLADGIPFIHSINGQPFALLSLNALRELQDAASASPTQYPCPRTVTAIVEWLRSEAQLCDCFARSSTECACGAWDNEPAERSYKTAYVEDIADAIAAGEPFQQGDE
jgi:hypothetical protein